MSHRDFIEKWKQSQGREDSNAKPFPSDFCYEIDLPAKKSSSDRSTSTQSVTLKNNPA